MGHRYLVLLLVIFVLVTALPCHAAGMTPEQRAKLWFAAHDRGHVGYLTADVVVAYELRRFKRMDSYSAGKLSLGEFCGGVPSDQLDEMSHCRGLFIAMDRNGDGYVTEQEVANYYRDVVQRADQKGDGRVTLDEWLASKQEQ